MAETTKRRVRNTFDYKTGLPVMVNLLIIRTIYYGMKNKDRRFVADDTKHKKKYVPVYSDNILDISRSRYDRLQRGAPFEISQREAKRLAELFNISTKYFRRDEPEQFPVEGLNTRDWKCYYTTVREIDYGLEKNMKKEDIKKRSELVESKLKEIANTEWSNDTDDANPLFRIWYYFRTGKKYDKTNAAVSCMKELRNLQLAEWECLYDNENIEQYREILKRHYEYVDALVKIKKMRNS